MAILPLPTRLQFFQATALAATMLTLAAAPLPAASAQAVSLSGRNSVQWSKVFCGAAIESDQVEDGSRDAFRWLDPAPLAISGNGAFGGVNYVWDCSWAYDVAQTYSASPSQAAVASLTSEGHNLSSISGFQATYGVDSTNYQEIEFVVWERTDYQLDGEAWGGQSVGLRQWDAVHQHWYAVFPDYRAQVFSRPGVFEPGRYRIVTSPYTFTADGSPPAVQATWTYQLSFPNAALGARCGNFDGQSVGTDLGRRFRIAGASFKSNDRTHAVVVHGEDAAGSIVHGGRFGAAGLTATLNRAAAQLMVLLLPTGQPVTLRARNGAGTEVAVTTVDGSDSLTPVQLNGADMRTVEISGGDGNAVLALMCAMR